MIRYIKITLIVMTISCSPVRSEPGPVENWLMNDPLTLFDWGLYKADKQAELAADWIKEWYVLDYTGAYVRYDWEYNEINFKLLITQQADILVGHCDLYRQVFIKYLLSRIYWTPEELAGLEFTSSDIAETLDSWFSHSGFAQLSRPEDLGKKLARIVWVEVDMIADSASKSKIRGISCKARITEFEAPYKIR